MTDNSADPKTATNRQAEWAALYDQYSVDVWRYVARLLGRNEEAVGDTVQETFLAAARAFHQFDPARGTVWAWLTGIAHRQVALYYRGKQRSARDLGPLDEAVPATGVADPLEQRETAELVRRVLTEMPADAATVLQGKYCDEATVAELVARHGGTTEGVRSKLARARREFRRRFERFLSTRSSNAPVDGIDTK